MGIWIRSQNRHTLVNTTKLQINHSLYDCGCEIVGSLEQDKSVSLGIYGSTSEAFKVLDMAQKHIEKSSSKIFKMPEYGFTENKYYNTQPSITANAGRRATPPPKETNTPSIIVVKI